MNTIVEVSFFLLPSKPREGIHIGRNREIQNEKKRMEDELNRATLIEPLYYGEKPSNKREWNDYSRFIIKSVAEPVLEEVAEKIEPVLNSILKEYQNRIEKSKRGSGLIEKILKRMPKYVLRSEDTNDTCIEIPGDRPGDPPKGHKTIASVRHSARPDIYYEEPLTDGNVSFDFEVHCDILYKPDTN